MNTDEITILRPFEAHFHARKGKMMEDVLPETTHWCAGGVAMGNLPGEEVIDTLEKRMNYADWISSIAPSFNAIVPLMVTQNLLRNAVQDSILHDAKVHGIRVVKFIPGGGITTNGATGLTLYDLYSRYFRYLLEWAQDCGVIFSCHFELGTDQLHDGKEIRPVDQEKEAIPFLQYLLIAFPRLKIIVEHASSEEMINFITSLPAQYKVAATLTPHHAIMHHGHNHDPLLNCKPCIKSPADNRAVKIAMGSGDPRFFAGTDSAPQLLGDKLREVNPAFGNFTAPTAWETYAEIFSNLGREEYMGNFTSVYGPQFYGVEPSKEKLTLVKEPYEVPHLIRGIPVFRGGTTIPWSIAK